MSKVVLKKLQDTNKHIHSQVQNNSNFKILKTVPNREY